MPVAGAAQWLCLSCSDVTVVCRRVAQCLGCFVSGLDSVQRGLFAFEEELAKEFKPDGDRRDESAVRWL